MRLAMVAQWLRAAASDPGRRVTARRYAVGITVLQLAWVGMLWVPHLLGAGIPRAGGARAGGAGVGRARRARPRGTRITSPNDTVC